MRLGFRAKLFLISLGLVAVSTLLVFLYVRVQLERRALTEIEADLRVRTRLAAGRVEAQLHFGPGPVPWQDVALELGRSAAARVTIIRKDGVVLGDSGSSPRTVSTLQNHAHRPEVQQALRSGWGVQRRHSATLEHDLLYGAVPIGQRSEPMGVVRIALELKEVGRQVQDFQHALTVGAVLALVTALFTSLAAAVVASRSARALTLAATRMAQGDLSTRVPRLGKDEFGELGRALQQLNANLSATLEEARTSRDRMSGILSRMHEGVLLLDEAGKTVLLNPALRQMMLLSDEGVGRPPSEFIKNVELTQLLQKVAQTRQGQFQEIEVKGLMPRRLLVRAAPVGGDGDGIFAVFFDVTEMRRLENLRRDFVANVSHELRTPVTAIRSAAETLRDAAQSDPSAAPRFVDIMARNAERLGNLVDDLLELSRIESRALKLSPQSVDVRELVDHVVSLFRERADRKGQILETAIEPALCSIVTDRRALENVLANLIDNAVKYSGAGATVRVRAFGDPAGCRFVVEDTGPGMEATHLPRIFERFYRVDTGRSRELGGTGLGLAIVKHLVEALAGQIQVQSTPGVGTSFEFTLPVAGPRTPERSIPVPT